ncbi:hypothetical protein Nepgr_029458 [Nepenthes gracilis]|uniref:Protein kinase domain-containing protein n=1 Tax=Nepenthes gracilis TaxID=150966 RepID=A0AAD3Y4V3_NEPGR|nr:hypothetical protein Nepgr_029458 [Nepenthes gracilis]
MPQSSPPPPPPHLVQFSLVLLTVFTAQTSAYSYSSRPSSNLRSPCPPFNGTTLPFPFSSVQGYGHPYFHIQCTSPHSLISINNLSFSVLRFESSSSSLILSPHPVAAAAQRCFSASHFRSIPSQPISLSGSPFTVSDASCSRLSVLKPCPLRTLPNCSLCPWQCSLIENPVRLLHDCGSRHRLVSESICQIDVLGVLDDFLKWGIQIEWEEVNDGYFTNCKACQSMNGVCGFNSSDPKKPFLCFDKSPVTFSSPWIQHTKMGRIIAFCAVFVVVCLLCVISTAFIVFRNRRMANALNLADPTSLFLHRHRSANLLPPVFTYQELETSTNQFDPKRKIGDGGFGSVYLGQLYDGRVVAVKHLHRHHQSAQGGRACSTKSFCNEILIFSTINHPNLVKLHGYCSDPRGLLLVYDYVPNGTLADHLHGPRSLYRKQTLNWPVRIDIALQIATAIEYLHFYVQPPVVHRDITTSNIFVERDMRVKVGDFGLSRLLVYPDPDSSSATSGCVWTGPQGTPGYLDPDYHRSFLLTEKSDVYSFGVVLLELVTGLKAVDQRREKREMALVDMVVSRIQMGLLRQVVDPVLAAEGEVSLGVGAVAELAFRCVAAEKDDRPDAKEVVTELRRIRNSSRGVKASNSNVTVVVPES